MLPIHARPPTSEPQPARIVPADRVRAEYHPHHFPVPYYRVAAADTHGPGEPPARPARGFFTYPELPRLKLRGLGPADSLILRVALKSGMFDPAHVYLAGLIPTTLADVDRAEIPLSRDRLHCPDPPLQFDFAYPEAPPPHDAHAAAQTRPATTSPGHPLHLLIVEVKPNAGYVAAGQALAYVWAWNRLFADRWPATPAILTDLPRPWLPAFAAEHDITLFSLGHLLIDPPAFPT